MAGGVQCATWAQCPAWWLVCLYCINTVHVCCRANTAEASSTQRLFGVIIILVWPVLWYSGTATLCSPPCPARALHSPPGTCRRLLSCSADGWWGAVRHVGTIFGLAPNADAFDSFGLPFPDLAVTISQIQVRADAGAAVVQSATSLATYSVTSVCGDFA